MSMDGYSTGSGGNSYAEDDGISGTVNVNVDSAPNTRSQDGQVESLAFDFGQSNLYGDLLGGGASSVSAEEPQRRPSNKRRVAKEYSGRIQREEVLLRSRTSERGSSRAIVVNEDNQRSVKHHSVSGAAALGYTGPDPYNISHSSGSMAQQAPSLSTLNTSPEVAFQTNEIDDSSPRKITLQRMHSAGSEVKERLKQIVKKTFIRKGSSATTEGGEKVDGRSAVDRVAAPPKHWSPEEDNLLRQSVALHGEKHWKKIAEGVPGRNHTQCLQRWSKVLTPGLKKGQWSLEEDNKLLELATRQLQECDAAGKERKVKWGTVKKDIPGRTAKQCRERWKNNLDPSIKRSEWSREEDETIIALFEAMPQKWAAIAKACPGRTENAVKVRWKYLNRGGGIPIDNSYTSGQGPSATHVVHSNLQGQTGAVLGAQGHYYASEQQPSLPPPPQQQDLIYSHPSGQISTMSKTKTEPGAVPRTLQANTLHSSETPSDPNLHPQQNARSAARPSLNQFRGNSTGTAGSSGGLGGSGLLFEALESFMPASSPPIGSSFAPSSSSTQTLGGISPAELSPINNTQQQQQQQYYQQQQHHDHHQQQQQHRPSPATAVQGGFGGSWRTNSSSRNIWADIFDKQ